MIKPSLVVLDKKDWEELDFLQYKIENYYKNLSKLISEDRKDKWGLDNIEELKSEIIEFVLFWGKNSLSNKENK
jgi:hypothetical protein